VSDLGETARNQSVRLSIVIPVFNEAATIGRLIESLARIRSGEVEFVVSDNASTDGTSDVAGRCSQDTRLRIVVHSDHVSIFESSMRALSIARGNHSLMIGGDDWVYPEAVDEFVSVLVPGVVYCPSFSRDGGDASVYDWYSRLELDRMRDPFTHPSFQRQVNVDEMMYAAWPKGSLPPTRKYLRPALEPQWAWVFRDVAERCPVRPWPAPLWHKSMGVEKDRDHRAALEASSLRRPTRTQEGNARPRGYRFTRRSLVTLSRGVRVSAAGNPVRRLRSLWLSCRMTDDVFRGETSLRRGITLLRWFPAPVVFVLVAPAIDLLAMPAAGPIRIVIKRGLERFSPRLESG
jgi:hypothetical protein